MDLELLRTFLTVYDSGSFQKAAERLHVTQSALSMRMRRLEDELGRRLLTRGRNGVRLTDAGRQFFPYATDVLQSIRQARDAIQSAEGFEDVVTLSARFALWDGFLLDCIAEMQSVSPNTSFRSDIGLDEPMMDSVLVGKTDLALMFTPHSRPGLAIEKLFEERVILVEAPDGHGTPNTSFVGVGWGPDFNRQLLLTTPEMAQPSLVFGIGWLALQHILRNGGRAYLPQRLTRNYIEEGRLAVVSGVPDFRLPCFAVCAIAERDRLAPYIEILWRRAELFMEKRH